MAKKWFTSDWHLADDRMSLLRRPFKDAKEARDTLVKNYNECVSEDDIAYFIGDIALDEEWLKSVGDLNGHKILIKGNYDQLDDDIYKKYFNGVGSSVTIWKAEDPDKKSEEILNLHLVHYPTHAKADFFNLVGHIHGCWKIQKNMLNVSIDCHNFKPISLEEVYFFYRAICNFYDQDVWVANHEANRAYDFRGKAGTYSETGEKGSFFSKK